MPRAFDGSHLKLPGASGAFVLYGHQKRGIWRIIASGATYLAHAVGAGKTMTMAAAIMEQRRLGLTRVAREEGAYQGWAPAQYCWYLYREGEFGGRPFRQANGLQPVAVGYLSVASTGLPEGIDQVVVTYFTNSDRLAGILSGARLRVDEIDLTLGLIPEEETALSRRRYTAKHGRTTVQWDGGPGAARPVEIRTLGLLGRTIGGSAHRIEATITPDSVFASSGTLKVSGTGELQRLLAASPIRLVASFLRGGDTDWSFGR